MKTDLEKFQEIVADIKTTIFGSEVDEYKFKYQKYKRENIILNKSRTTKPKRGRGRPKGSKNKRNKWL